MTKIMIVLTSFERGGVSRAAANLLDSLDRDKFDIVLVIEKILDGHYPIDNHVRLINLNISPKKRLLSKIYNIIKHLISIRRQIIKEAPDVILSITTGANCYALFSLLFRLHKRPKIIIAEHSEEMFLNLRRGSIRFNLYRLLMSFLYHRADYIVSVSEGIAKHIRKLWFVPSHKVKVIYNPVNINKIKRFPEWDNSFSNFKAELPYIGTVSRLSPEKGIHFLVEGFKGLLEKIDARLIIVGDGIERDRLEKMVRDLDIKEKVVFTGWEDDPFEYLQKMDIFVLPSLWEGFSNVILEAMVNGVPVIATDSSGGVREVIKNGVNGLLIEPKSPLAISESAYYLLSNADERGRLIREAYGTIGQFDLSVIKKQYENLIFN